MVIDIPYDSSRIDNIVFEEYKALRGFLSLKKRGLNFLINKNYQKQFKFSAFIKKYGLIMITN